MAGYLYLHVTILLVQGVKPVMEKTRIKPIKSGRGIRMSYSRRNEVLEMPNLIEVQKDSYDWFLTDGLKEAFDDISPIEDVSGRYCMEFI